MTDWTRLNNKKQKIKLLNVSIWGMMTRDENLKTLAGHVESALIP